MREFIESIVKSRNLDFRYDDYETLFVKHYYNSYYLFFFLNNRGQLVTLRKEAGNVFRAIKENKELYQPDMDKNITCIFFLQVEENEYYEIEENTQISELDKVICFVEEDLNYFKKNVLLYTKCMDDFARKNVGRFETLCQEYFTEENFQIYKNSKKDIFEYDFLVNLFIKIPFLNFHAYQKEANKKYQTMEEFIEEECRKKEINHSYIDRICGQLEEYLDDETKLNEWLDKLVLHQIDEDKRIREVAEDEN